jgi:MinD-like ATPase involved in chromosome partitioning or flagellar assembly
LDASDVERVMKVQVDAMIPSSRLVPTSLNKGRPVVVDEPSSEVAVAVRQLAGKFVEAAGAPEGAPSSNAEATKNGDGRKKRRRFART